MEDYWMDKGETLGPIWDGNETDTKEANEGHGMDTGETGDGYMK